MKKIKNLVLVGLLMVFALSLNFNQQEAEAQQIMGRVIATKCVLVSTGETVGYSNNCGAGAGTCVDGSCTDTSNQSFTSAN